MAHSTVPVLSSPDFPQVYESAITHFAARVLNRPQLSTCDYSSEHCDCWEAATVSHLELEQEFCLEHFQKAVQQ